MRGIAQAGQSILLPPVISFCYNGVMNLTQLRYFVAVARTQNFSRAARELHISQPALTRQIKLLESEIDSSLMERNPRGVTLTDSGKLLLERAEYQLRVFEQLRADFADASFAPSGRLRIGCPPSLNTFLMPRPFTQFMLRHPKVILEIQESVSDQLARDILDDRLDIAIASATGRADNPHLLTQTLFEEPVWMFGPPGSELQANGKNLETLPMILTRSNNAARGVVEQDLAKRGLKINVVAETDSPQLMIEMMKAGTGYTIAPYLTFHHHLRQRELTGMPLKLRIERRLIRRKDRPSNRAMESFTALLLPEIDRALREIARAQRKTRG